MTYDPEREICVLFGGQDGEFHKQRFGDTWEFDGTRWRFITEQGPGPGHAHGSAYDPVVRAVRVYMGVTGLRGTWDWNGRDWVQRSTQYLGIAFGASMAYDERRGVMVLHGGWATYPNPFWSETWEWNGLGWSRVSSWGPVAQAYESMVYDPNRGACVTVASGYTAQWNGASWSVIAEGDPPSGFREMDAMAYDSHRGVTVLFGGGRTDPIRLYGDTWELDGQGWRLASTVGPSPRIAHSMAFDSRRGVTVLFGGDTETGVSNETWEWDGQTWTLFNPCYADCDTSTGKRVLDIFDFLCFQNRYEVGLSYACDCDTSTGLDVCDIFDFLCFQNAYEAGCP